MPNTEKKKYKHNYLTQVICQMKFNKCESISDETLKSYKIALGSSYSELATIKQQGIIIENLGSDIKSHIEDSNIWEIQSADNTHKITVTPESFAITHTTYTKFRDYIEVLSGALELFLQKFSEVGHINRLGLRYVNQITPRTLKNGWNEYINEKLTAPLDFVDTSKLRRSMHTMNLQHDEDIKMNINFGIFNEYFPAPITKNEFIIDLDAFTETIVEPNEWRVLIERFNATIAIYFELSIIEKLRQEMGVIEDEKE